MENLSEVATQTAIVSATCAWIAAVVDTTKFGVIGVIINGLAGNVYRARNA
jgi:hypothetical protein